MSLRSRLAPHIASRLLSQSRLEQQRAKIERKRAQSGAAHVLEVFHDPSDPYSGMLVQVLPDLAARYRVDIRTHIISPPSDSAVPERGLLAAYARTDAERLARKAGIEFACEPAAAVGDTAEADARLAELGHYQGGMIYYGGEWYWGIDRLHYLEDRLTALGLRSGGADTHVFTPPNVPRRTANETPKTGIDLHWYFSFRSPYSAISVDRISALADVYGANLKLRFVLPMVMRGLPIPATKKRYIPRDTAREAHRLGVPFGKICDPVGKPVERGYAVLHWAIAQDRGLDFVRSFFTAVWSQGVDAGPDKGFRRIVEMAGLNWADAKLALNNNDWRAAAEVNRSEMMDRGIWGVPSFRINDDIVWGQDRIWAVEDSLQSLGKSE